MDDGYVRINEKLRTYYPDEEVIYIGETLEKSTAIKIVALGK